ARQASRSLSSQTLGGRSQAEVVEVLALEQHALTPSTPPIAGEAAILLQYPMAWNRHRDLVGRASLPHLPRGARLAKPAGQLAITAGSPGGNLLQARPDLTLEVGTAHIDRHAGTSGGTLDQTLSFFHGLLQTRGVLD